ncbi:HepT-like ribonuclease domain-containing protein [Curtobacterium flaccumfaciens]|uniref:HepT-like ribonuclease domain-containing protein n=1 Tax=Curtobacterium flaccumfaciens TaxID=2035 RepID=UPI001BDDCF5E|nr:HepT-like ribonuclease domain-containing protein [Curtobacterium flaccumfaciens]MBT1684251.1 DUF86 domain-containing protein [Curtobacterium flaccumfaciens pv. flaccumfaciens]
MPAPRFTPRPRNDRDPAAPDERWPSLQASFLDLLAECSMIVEHGRSEFDAARSLTYRAAEAVIIHFDDLLGRIPPDREARLPSDLSLAAVRKTRNILSHDYRKARTEIVWDTIEHRIPAVILALVG